jgi:hypothetical protein
VAVFIFSTATRPTGSAFPEQDERTIFYEKDIPWSEVGLKLGKVVGAALLLFARKD